LHVLGGLLLRDGEGVVGADDTDEASGLVEDGESEVMILGELAGDMFLVVVDVEGFDFAEHEVIDEGIGRAEDQFAEREDAEEGTVIGGDVEVGDIGGFGGAPSAEAVEDFGDGDTGGEGDEAAVHDAAGGILGVAQEGANGLGGGGGQGGEDLFAT